MLSLNFTLAGKCYTNPVSKVCKKLQVWHGATPTQFFQGSISLRDLFPIGKAQLKFEIHNKVGK